MQVTWSPLQEQTKAHVKQRQETSEGWHFDFDSVLHQIFSEFLLVLGTVLGDECTLVNKSLKALTFMEFTSLVKQAEMI